MKTHINAICQMPLHLCASLRKVSISSPHNAKDLTTFFFHTVYIVNTTSSQKATALLAGC